MYAIWPPPFIHEFDQWSDSTKSTASYENIKMDSDKEIMASYKPNNYALTAFIGIPIGIVTIASKWVRERTWERLKS
jgi:hypothetical protein